MRVFLSSLLELLSFLKSASKDILSVIASVVDEFGLPAVWGLFCWAKGGEESVKGLVMSGDP